MPMNEADPAIYKVNRVRYSSDMFEAELALTALLAVTNIVGHAFQIVVGHLFRFEAGHWAV